MPITWASLVAQKVKRLPAMQETRFDPWVRKIPWGRKWHPTPVLLPGKSHGQRSLVGYSPWDHKELDTTERLHVSFTWKKLYLSKLRPERAKSWLLKKFTIGWMVGKWMLIKSWYIHKQMKDWVDEWTDQMCFLAEEHAQSQITCRVWRRGCSHLAYLSSLILKSTLFLLTAK